MRGMRDTALEFCVVGTGRLAAAARQQLPLFGLSSIQESAESGCARLVMLACSDYLCPAAFTDLNRRAWNDGATLLFARLTECGVAIGPMVVPPDSPGFECRAPAADLDFGLSDFPPCVMRTAYEPLALHPDTRLTALAHVGALLLARELTALRFGAWPAWLVGHVAKFDPPWSPAQIIALPRTRKHAPAVRPRRQESRPTGVPGRAG